MKRKEIYRLRFSARELAGAIVSTTTLRYGEEAMQRLSLAVVHRKNSLGCVIGVGCARSAKTTRLARYQPGKTRASRRWSHNCVDDGTLNSTATPPYFATASSRISLARAVRVVPARAAATVLRLTLSSWAICATPPRSTIILIVSLFDALRPCGDA